MMGLGPITNGNRKLLIVLIVISSLICVASAIVVSGIFILDSRTRAVDLQTQVIALQQADFYEQQNENTKTIDKLQNAVNEGWQTFQKHNPTQPIPQIVEPADSQTKVVISPPLFKPTPTPKAIKPAKKHKPRIKSPTPKPFYNWFKHKP